MKDTCFQSQVWRNAAFPRGVKCAMNHKEKLGDGHWDAMKNNDAKDRRVLLQSWGVGVKKQIDFSLWKLAAWALGQEFSRCLGCPSLLLLLLVIHRIPSQAKFRSSSLGIFHPKQSSILPGWWEQREGQGDGHILPDISATSVPTLLMKEENKPPNRVLTPVIINLCAFNLVNGLPKRRDMWVW